MRTTRSIAAAAVLAAALTGCTTSGGVDDTPAAGTNRPTAEEPAETEAGGETAAESEPTETQGAAEADTPTNPAFGDTYTWDDGVAITVSAPEPFTPSQYAAGTEGFTQFVRFTITVVNGSPENFDPTLVYPTLQSGNAEASAVFDSEQGLEGFPPSTALLPGREVAWSVGYGVMDPADLVMEISPGPFEYEAVIFTG